VVLADAEEVEPHRVREHGLGDHLPDRLGLAVLASIAASRTDSLRAAGHGALSSLNGGYHIAFVVGAIFAAGAAALGSGVLRVAHAPAHEHGGEFEAAVGAAE
jgi:hypothetical protein